MRSQPQGFLSSVVQIQKSESISEHYGRYCKPDLQHLLFLLKLDVSYTRAKEEFLYYLQDGVEVPVLDILGGYGATLLGHNHPELKAVLKQALDEDCPVQAQASVRGGAAALAEKLNTVVQLGSFTQRDTRDYRVHLLSTGAEATEAALKHSLMAWQLKTETIRKMVQVQNIRPVWVAIEGSFHGKTAGAVAMSGNPAYSEMYPTLPVETVFVPRQAKAEEIREIFRRYRIQKSGVSAIAGVIVEVVQGEGGIQVLSAELLSTLFECCQLERVPFIADEIQSGLFRTGKWLASHHLGIQPDLILLGKSLGGGISKIAALMIRSDQYVDSFAMKHTSTFAEDDLSSRVALRTLELLEVDQTRLPVQAEHFQRKIFEAVEKLRVQYPGVIREVRGLGWMLGIEFDFQNEKLISHALDSWRSSGYLTYVFSSYLLHRHKVRVAATLNQSQTLRIEPSAYISMESADHFISALGNLIQLLAEGRLFELTAHLIDAVPAQVISPIPAYKTNSLERKFSQPLRRVVFVSHVVNEKHLTLVDPCFRAMNSSQREKFLKDYSFLGGNILLHEQVIENQEGERVLFELRGIAADSRFFERCIRQNSQESLKKVVTAVQEARMRQATHIGLGQYTSIVTDNGRLIPATGAPVTTGNSLTIGLTWEALKELLSRRKQEISKLHVGVVGIAGNICNVYAQILADHAKELTLIHREPFAKSDKFKKAVQMVLDHSEMDPQQIHCEHELSSLKDCDVVVVGTNSTSNFLMPEHLKQNALVLDISVPSNLHPSVLRDRPDIEYVQGGYAKLPKNQVIECPTLFSPPGETFACLAETLTVGFCNYPESFSLGHLNKEKVFQIMRMAKQVGFKLGSMKRASAF